MKTLTTLIVLVLLLVQSGLYGQDWKPKGYAYVVGYTYDYTKDPLGLSIILKDGSIHDGVIRAATVRLNQRQIVALLELLKERSDDKEYEEAECHEPHHAFVFYDHGWKAVAWINICFHCLNTSTNTRGNHARIDLEPLEKFCNELGMPVMQDASDYSKLYKAEQGEAQQPAILPDAKDHD
jgi:hypothetical protein